MQDLEWSLSTLLASIDNEEYPEADDSNYCGDRYYTVSTIGLGTKGNVKIEMYGKEHYPYHFRVRAPDAEIDAIFDLQTCEFCRGEFPQKYEKYLIMWHAEHLPKLVSKWNEYNPDKIIR